MKLNLAILDETGWTDSEGSNSDSEEEEYTDEIKRILTEVRSCNRRTRSPDLPYQKQLVAPTVEDNHSTHLGSEFISQA